MDLLNTGLLLLVLATIIGATSFGLKTLWAVDKKVVTICRDAKDNHDDIKENNGEIKLLERKVVKKFAEVDCGLLEVRSEILAHEHPAGGN